LRERVNHAHPWLSVARQCALLGLARSTAYYEAARESEENLWLMRRIDEQYLRTPFYGSRRMAVWLQSTGQRVNRKRVQRLMQVMGIEALYPKRRTTVRGEGHKIYPYLLRDLAITRPDQVWSADITYVPLRRGFMYLVAVLDWFSRYVLSWRLSNSLETTFCLEALDEALARRRPEIFNTDQGVQFTSEAFTSRLSSQGVAISMDGRGRALDNVFIERLWRSVKHEDIYLKDYGGADDLYEGLEGYFRFYDQERPHQALAYQTPAAVYEARTVWFVPRPKPR
jgi:putative transposase